MNEDQIANDLAQSVPNPTADHDYSYPSPEPSVDQDFVDKMTPEETLTRNSLMDYFGVPISERHSPNVDHWANEIYDWAREQAGSGDYQELLRVIREQEQFMGSRLKEQRMYKLYQYVKINRVRQQLAQREKALYADV